MDKPRTGFAEKQRVRRTIMLVGAVAAIILVTLGIRQIEPAAPPVRRETLWIDNVKRGAMVLEVRGPGTLVPVDIRVISAPVEGRVERIPALPGATVQADTVLMELTDPEVEQAAVEAESQLRAAEADFEDLKAQLESQLLNQQAQVSAASSAAEEAKLQSEADEVLAKDGIIPDINLKRSRLRATQTGKQSKIESQRYSQSQKSNQAQLAAQRARVDQMRALYGLRRRQLDSLKVRAGIPGVLQELPMQVGQRVTPGTTLARVARPENLKAELRIPEGQARDVVRGMQASIDTRNGVVRGRVFRVAPSAQEGSVIVDVVFDGPLPRGARPNLSVDGTIQLDRLDNVLYIGRPAVGQSGDSVQLFKLVKGTDEAVRVPVKLGRSSVTTMEIVSGLEVGDEVILSDTSAQDDFDRIRLE
ncbi:MAG TPA: HlyD family efflux transporter periplasmic adaptor subunit [Thermoanaerobaculia bacterium]|jgi:HlyD family secretion protein|nr:HlyD family efflux transporter periplasmic adaptor subunit [Thermoanaerobaculia bacterium]